MRPNRASSGPQLAKASSSCGRRDRRRASRSARPVRSRRPGWDRSGAAWFPRPPGGSSRGCARPPRVSRHGDRRPSWPPRAAASRRAHRAPAIRASLPSADGRRIARRRVELRPRIGAAGKAGEGEQHLGARGPVVSAGDANQPAVADRYARASAARHRRRIVATSVATSPPASASSCALAPTVDRMHVAIGEPQHLPLLEGGASAARKSGPAASIRLAAARRFRRGHSASRQGGRRRCRWPAAACRIAAAPVTQAEIAAAGQSRTTPHRCGRRRDWP